MMKLLDTTHTVFATEAEANAAAAEMKANDEDGWTYEVRIDPKGSGRAVIDIYDEDGFLAATF